MIMYRVSKEHSLVELKEHDIISSTDKTVTYLSHKTWVKRESKVKSLVVWFEQKYKAVELAEEWADIKVGSAYLALNNALKAQSIITNLKCDLIALGESK